MFWNRTAGPPGLPVLDLLTRSVTSAISRMGSASVWMRFSSPARSRAAIHWRRSSKGKEVSCVCESTTRAFTTEAAEDHGGKVSAAKDTTVTTEAGRQTKEFLRWLQTNSSRMVGLI